MGKAPFQIIRAEKPADKISVDEWVSEVTADLLAFKEAVHAKMIVEPRFHKALNNSQWESLFEKWRNEYKGWIVSSTIKGSILDYQLEVEDKA